MSMRSVPLLLIVWTSLSGLPGCVCRGYAECPVYTITMKGRVERAQPGSRVRVQLYYPKAKSGESGEVTIEDGTFAIAIQFLTQSRKPILSNLPPKCERKPTTVAIEVLQGDQECDHVFLEFPADFKMADPSAYVLRSELVLHGRP